MVWVTFVHDGSRGGKRHRGARQETESAMSDTQRTTIARLDERLETLKERL